MKPMMWAVLAAAMTGTAFAGPVNINTADAKTLAKELKGVGLSKAEAIVKYRAEKGGFKSPEELENVQGIGKAIYEKNKTLIRLKD
ncbi:MAG TPA: helix-hairpin-helix domain-containing protein [Candidatus Binatia bacterium]|nr:helix-hairpin-helix domain-containing protein [Candidatus Binatia bacterium]